MPEDPVTAAINPVSDQVANILKQLQSQAPEVLEMGVSKVRTTAELQILGYAVEWVAFLIIILLLRIVWRRYFKLEASETEAATETDAVWAGIAAVIAAGLLLVIIGQACAYLPDQVSFVVNARYYAVLELIHQIRG